uniref:Uncharacterized protein n=1 Tax=Zea mays TaxID=4577 RepID=A0A804LXH1_MAIZE
PLPAHPPRPRSLRPPLPAHPPRPHPPRPPSPVALADAATSGPARRGRPAVRLQEQQPQVAGALRLHQHHHLPLRLAPTARLLYPASRLPPHRQVHYAVGGCVQVTGSSGAVACRKRGLLIILRDEIMNLVAEPHMQES